MCKWVVLKISMYAIFILHHSVIFAQVTDGYQTYHDLKEQFTISLPNGWSVYKQTEAVTGKPSSLGVIVFSEQSVTKSGENLADPEMLGKVDTGETPSFFVDRIPAYEGMSCEKFGKSDAYNLGVKLMEDPIFGEGRKLTSAVPVKHERIVIAGCQGFQYEGRGKKGEWIIDVRAVSDGKICYLFILRNRAEYFSKNIDTFNNAVATIQLAGQK